MRFTSTLWQLGIFLSLSLVIMACSSGSSDDTSEEESPPLPANSTALTSFQITSELSEKSGPSQTDITWAKVSAQIDANQLDGKTPLVFVRFQNTLEKIEPKWLELKYDVDSQTFVGNSSFFSSEGGTWYANLTLYSSEEGAAPQLLNEFTYSPAVSESYYAYRVNSSDSWQAVGISVQSVQVNGYIFAPSDEETEESPLQIKGATIREDGYFELSIAEINEEFSSGYILVVDDPSNDADPSSPSSRFFNLVPNSQDSSKMIVPLWNIDRGMIRDIYIRHGRYSVYYTIHDGTSDASSDQYYYDYYEKEFSDVPILRANFPNNETPLKDSTPIKITTLKHDVETNRVETRIEEDGSGFSSGSHQLYSGGNYIYSYASFLPSENDPSLLSTDLGKNSYGVLSYIYFYDQGNNLTWLRFSSYLSDEFYVDGEDQVTEFPIIRVEPQKEFQQIWLERIESDKYGVYFKAGEKQQNQNLLAISNLRLNCDSICVTSLTSALDGYQLTSISSIDQKDFSISLIADYSKMRTFSEKTLLFTIEGNYFLYLLKMKWGPYSAINYANLLPVSLNETAFLIE